MILRATKTRSLIVSIRRQPKRRQRPKMILLQPQPQKYCHTTVWMLLLLCVICTIMSTVTTTVAPVLVVHGFGNFVLPKDIFGVFTNNREASTTTTTTIVRPNNEAQKLQLFNAIRGTNNGKNTTPQQQLYILQLVRELELLQPNISISNPNILSLLNGTWYLQYTSPSVVEVDEDTAITTPSLQQQEKESFVWKPKNAQLENVETNKFNAQGTVSAAGITIDTSNNTLVQQIFDINTSTVMNRIYFDKTSSNNMQRYAIAGGSYRPSTVQPNRAIVAFDTAQINIPIGGTNNNTIQIPLGWFFSIIALFRKGNRDNGWLETTYIDTTLRIGRGNKGTMFILTREPLSLS